MSLKQLPIWYPNGVPDDISASKHHDGLDIRVADESTRVLAAAEGWLQFVQENNALYDHGMGNTVTVGHKLASGIVYTQYSHSRARVSRLVEGRSERLEWESSKATGNQGKP